MNTPGHAIVSLAGLGRGQSAVIQRWILAGSILPDAPMFLFYVIVRFIQGHPEDLIWNSLYFQPGWQALFDSFNSVPLVLLFVLIARWAGRPGPMYLGLSMLVHFVLDLPLHHDDGHRHLYPLSMWRFDSPVSYWDPAHFGHIMAPVEMLLVAGLSVILWQRHRQVRDRGLILMANLFYVAMWTTFYVLGGAYG